MQDTHRYEDTEIDLREYIEVIVKRKNIVLTVFSVLVLLVTAWSLISPKIYEVSMIIEPPVVAVTDSGVQSFDSAGNIKAKIESGAFNVKIINELNIPENRLQFYVLQPKDTRVIKVSLKRAADKTESGKKILAKLLEALNLNYVKFIEDKRNEIDNKIKTVASQIATKKNEIKLKNEQFKILADRERQLVEEIKETKANSERLLAKREALFERKENRDDISSLLYTTTIQQGVAYFTQLQNDLSDLKTRKENILNGIDNLKSGIDETEIEINNFNLIKASMQNILVVQEPTVSLRPIGPKSLQNILAAGIIGLIVGVLLVFLIESWGRRP